MLPLAQRFWLFVFFPESIIFDVSPKYEQITVYAVIY